MSKATPIDFEKISAIVKIDESFPSGLSWVRSGKQAGYRCKKYYRFSFMEDGRCISFHNHRVMYALHTQEDPGSLLVDHVDKNRWNNKISNLRLADDTQSSQNRNVRKNSKTGVIGVLFRKDIGKYRARITVNKKIIQLGNFESLSEAKSKRKEAESFYFGEFAP